MILLRIAKEQDLAVIEEIAAITWEPTYVPIMGREQVDYMLAKMYSKGALLGQLMKGDIFLIASLNGKDVGFASYSVLEHGDHVYKLHKLYVLPEMHGKGLGKFLINEVINKVRHAGGKKLQLNVNRANKAKEFYESAGFNIKETVDIEIGNGFFMNDHVMELPIVPI
ncbi:GNAT superfamily N-acetyltransferase [Pedobacter sp. CG_S7]|uniref:GNAT family N-acetyltransferase n=1 Tax=Pedobacter sp. CG_S7 TaxID=3143930 RepID=UPI003395CAE4